MYFVLEPEVAGHLSDECITESLGEYNRITEMHYVMDGRPSDDLLESYPYFVVTDRVRDQLLGAHLSGCEFGHAQISTSEFFDDMYSNVTLPPFSWLKVTGQAGVDDFGIAKDRRLVVFERALAVMQQAGQLSDCLIEPYVA